jgi:hypothetical protein
MGRFKRRQGVNHVRIGNGETQRMKRKRTGPGLGTIMPATLMQFPEFAGRIVSAIFSAPRRFQRKAAGGGT